MNDYRLYRAAKYAKGDSPIARVAELETENAKLKARVAELETNEGEMQEDIHNLEAEIAARVEQIAKLEAENEQLKARKSAKK